MKFIVTATDEAGTPIAAATTVSVNIGNIGSDGASAYDIAVDNGFSGTEAEWLTSLQGADGAGVVATVVAPLILTGDELSLDDSGYETAGAAAAAQAASQPLDSDLTAIAALSTTSFGRSLLALADAAAGRTALSLGTAATSASTDFQPVDSDLTSIAALTTTSFGRSLLEAANAAALRTLAGLVLGTDVYSKSAVDAGFQPLDSDLTAIAALTTTSTGRSLLAGADAAALRTILALGTAATVNTGTSSGDIPLLSTGGRLPIARIASGTPDGTKFVKDDGTLAVPSGGGSGALTVQSTQTAGFTAVDGSLYPVDATSGSITIVAPASGRFAVKRIDATANTVTVDPPSTATTDGDLTTVLNGQWIYAEFVHNGSNWYVAPTGREGAAAQPLDAELTAIAGLTSAADKVPYFTGSGTAALADLTAAGRALIDDADATAQRATLGLVIGTNVQAQDAELAAIAGLTSAADRLAYFTGSGTASLATFTAAGRALVDDADATAQRATLGLVIGTDVQAQDAELAAIAGLTSAADRVPYFTGSGTAALATLTTYGRSLVDDADAATARTTIGHAVLVVGKRSGALTVAAGTARIYNDTGRDLVITAVRATVETNNTGAALLVDVNKNGTTIFTTQSNRPSIAASGVTAKAAGIDVTAWPDGEYLTFDVDQVGSTIAGSDLTVQVTAR